MLKNVKLESDKKDNRRMFKHKPKINENSKRLAKNHIKKREGKNHLYDRFWINKQRKEMKMQK